MRPDTPAGARAQGFVSNRDSAGGTERGDPVETVLYAVFVATSARASVAELADMLQVGWQILTWLLRQDKRQSNTRQRKGWQSRLMCCRHACTLWKKPADLRKSVRDVGSASNVHGVMCAHKCFEAQLAGAWQPGPASKFICACAAPSRGKAKTQVSAVHTMSVQHRLSAAAILTLPAAQVDLSELRAAISIACRLGFASRLPNPRDGGGAP